MCEKCKYFKLYDDNEWTPWAEQVKERAIDELIHKYGSFSDGMTWLSNQEYSSELIEDFYERVFGTEPTDKEELVESLGFEEHDAVEEMGYFPVNTKLRWSVLALEWWLKTRKHDLTQESCEYEAEEGSKYCIFHMDADKKPDEKLRNKFIDVIRDKKSENFFKAANIGTLSLDQEIVDSPEDHKPIQLQYANIDMVSMEDAKVNQEVNLSYSIIACANFNKTIFENNIFLRRAKISEIDFESAQLHWGEVDFSQARFDGRVNFKNATFEGRKVQFEGVEFSEVDSGEVDFSETNWETQELTFKSVKSKRGMNFSQTNFTNNRTIFDDIIAEKPVDFNRAKFEKGQTTFDEAEFQAQSKFDEITVTGYELEFNKVHFQDSVTFAGGYFDCEVSFSEVYFRSHGSSKEPVQADRSESLAETDRSRGAEITNFSNTIFKGRKLNFRKSLIYDRISFKDSEFDCQVDFSNIRFNGSANFSGCEFKNRLTTFQETLFTYGGKFQEAIFHRGGNFQAVLFLNGQADFQSIEVRNLDILFNNAGFYSGASFDDANIYCNYTRFDNAEFYTRGQVGLSFEDALIDCTEISFNTAVVHAKKVTFENSNFLGTAIEFNGAQFKIPTISDSDIESQHGRSSDGVDRYGTIPAVNFKGVICRDSPISFENVVTKIVEYEPANSSEVFRPEKDGIPEKHIDVDDNSIEVNDLPIREELGGDPETYDIEGRIDEIDSSILCGERKNDRKKNDVTWKNAILLRMQRRGIIELEFEDIPEGHTTSGTTDDETIITGETKVHLNEKILRNVNEENDKADFTIEEALENVHKGNDESRTRFLRELANRNMVETTERVEYEPEIDLRQAKIEDGKLTQPDNDGPTLYNLEEATVGEVEITGIAENDYTEDISTMSAITRSIRRSVPFFSSEQEGAFENYRFYKTTFDGFDFEEHKEELRNSDWHIDTSKNNPDRDDDPAGKETTYRKAKNGAGQIGANRVASEFFIKELSARRHLHRKKFFDKGSYQLKRMYAFGANVAMSVFAGYGEKPGRTVLSSMGVLILFTWLYWGIWALTPDDENSIFEAAVLSAESFTTLVLGGTEVEEPLIQFFAYIEGFFGAFLIALFVFTLTRSIHR